jgi:hypothetical protein
MAGHRRGRRNRAVVTGAAAALLVALAALNNLRRPIEALADWNRAIEFASEGDQRIPLLRSNRALSLAYLGEIRRALVEAADAGLAWISPVRKRTMVPKQDHRMAMRPSA